MPERPQEIEARVCCVPDAKEQMPSAVIVGDGVEEIQDVQTWRRQCGCIRTSEKLKHILSSFPAPPPPSPAPACAMLEATLDKSYGYCSIYPQALINTSIIESIEKSGCAKHDKGMNHRTWQVVAELVQLVQLSVTATALALYYLIYCYMQLVYYTLRSALYFHNADGPMKITIGVVTVTSLIVGFHLILRMERLIGIIY